MNNNANKIKKNTIKVLNFSWLPNLFTCCNLICGFIGIVEVFQGQIHDVLFWVILAATFDFLDGFVARILKVSSSIGKQLDSLADMVTFGLLPALVMFFLLQGSVEEYHFLAFAAVSIAVFSALRLAKFNIDDRQQSHFIGLPTPANALFIVSLPHVIEKSSNDFNLILRHPLLLMGVVIFSSMMLVAPVRLFALKFKKFSFKGNSIRYIFLFVAVALLIVFKVISIPIIILFYIIISLFYKNKSL